MISMDSLSNFISIPALVLSIILSLLSLQILKRKLNGKKKYHPVAGTMFNQLLNFNRVHDYMTDLAAKHKTYRLLSPFRNEIYTSDPANVEYILKTNFENYGKGMYNYCIFRDLLGDGIFTVDGDKWRQQRKVSSHEFSTKVLRDFSSVIFQRSVAKLANIISKAATSNQVMDLQDLYMRSTLDSIFKVGFGVELDSMCGTSEEGTIFTNAFDDSSAITLFRFVDVLWKIKKALSLGAEGQLKKNVKIINDFVYKLIQSKAEQMKKSPNEFSAKKEDILSRFLGVTETDPTYLRDIILNFIIAGKDTTANNSFSGSLTRCCKHPEIQEKIAREIREATGIKEVTDYAEFAAVIEGFADDLGYAHKANWDSATTKIFLECVRDEILAGWRTNKIAYKFKTKPLEHEALMREVFTGATASGKHHWTSGGKAADVGEGESDSVDSPGLPPFTKPYRPGVINCKMWNGQSSNHRNYDNVIVELVDEQEDLQNSLINFKRLHHYMTDLAAKNKTYRLISPFRNEIYTSDPANVEYILKTNFENYGKGGYNYCILRDLLGDGIFTVDGDKWRQQRKVSSHEFSTKVLRDFSSVVFQKNVAKLANLISEAATSNQIMDIQDLFMKSTLDSIFKVAFGVELDSMCGSSEEGAKFSNAFDDSSAMTLLRYVDVFWKIKKALNVGAQAELKKNVKVIDAFVYKLIRSKIEQMDKSPNDLLFLQVSETDPKYLRDIILNFIIAGKDTTATTLSWFIYMVSKHPTIQEKVAQEIKEATGIEEVTNFAEFAANDTLPDGFSVRKGDMVAYQPYAMGRMKFLWGDDAEEFRPERWLDENGIFRQESPFKFTAFQAGPRICLGKEFAYRQMKIFSAVLLGCFVFKLSDDTKAVNYRTMINLHIDRGLHVRAFHRLAV
ncbi:hypothetical protein HYC85_010882 [Camellia sinensis]|uniref:Uncharacterized protein n=1 Tax=Camellia sinensis TaxID=4442 RepID=A0A7J7HLT0_CAMSI|nr:hypothetical protein HYC85_010882 [Camellia sinensis]